MDFAQDVDNRLRRFVAVTVVLLAAAVGSLGTLAVSLKSRRPGPVAQAEKP